MVSDDEMPSPRWFVWVVIAAMIVTLVIPALAGWTSGRTFTGTVIRTYVEDGRTYFMIQEDGSGEQIAYENVDAWFFLKFGSEAIRNQLQVGRRYSFGVYGWRVVKFAWFPNIIWIKPVGIRYFESVDPLNVRGIFLVVWLFFEKPFFGLFLGGENMGFGWVFELSSYQLLALYQFG